MSNSINVILYSRCFPADTFLGIHDSEYTENPDGKSIDITLPSGMKLNASKNKIKYDASKHPMIKVVISGYIKTDI